MSNRNPQMFYMKNMHDEMVICYTYRRTCYRPFMDIGKTRYSDMIVTTSSLLSWLVSKNISTNTLHHYKTCHKHHRNIWLNDMEKKQISFIKWTLQGNKLDRADSMTNSNLFYEKFINNPSMFWKDEMGNARCFRSSWTESFISALCSPEAERVLQA